MDFLVLQDLSTVRYGGFARGKAPKMKKKKIGKVCCWSLRCSSSSSLSLTNRQVSSKNGHISSSTQVTDSYSSDFKNRLWELISKEQLEEGFTYLKNIVVSSQGEALNLGACRGLIEALCRTGRSRMAAQVVELLECYETTATLDTRTYSKFLQGLCKAGEVDSALKLLDRLHSSGRCKPDVYMYNTLIIAMFRKGRFRQVMKLLDDMRSKGCKAYNYTCYTVVNGMCRQGRLDEAFRFVTSSRYSSYGWTPSVESYNVVLNCLCHTGRLNDASKLLALMDDREGCSPSAATFMILIRTLCRKGLLFGAISLLESMLQYGCTPNLYHYNRVFHGLLCKQNGMGLGVAIEFIELMISQGCYPTVVIFNTLLAALWEHGKVDAAFELYNELIASRICLANLATYNIVIQGLSSLGRVDEALRVLEEVRGMEGFKPGEIVYPKLVVALIGEGKTNEAMEFFDELKRSEVSVPAKCYNWIIKALCGVGEIDLAIDVVVYMVSKGRSRIKFKPSHTTFEAVIEGLARAGLCTESMELLKELIVIGAMNRGMSIGLAERLQEICRLE